MFGQWILVGHLIHAVLAQQAHLSQHEILVDNQTADLIEDQPKSIEFQTIGNMPTNG